MVAIDYKKYYNHGQFATKYQVGNPPAVSATHPPW